MKKDNLPQLILFYSFLIISLAIWILNSDGFYFIDDRCHFNFNRHFLDSPESSINAWSRVGRVLLFFIPAQFGLKGVQIFGALIFIFSVHIAYKILKIKNVNHAEWVIPIMGFQPLLFNISYTVLAEVPAMALITLSYYFYLKNKPYLCIIASSMIFTFRFELFFVCGIFCLIYLYQRNWKVIPFSLIGPLFWFLLAWVFTGNIMAFFQEMTLHFNLPRTSEGIKWYHYLYMSPKSFGILQSITFIIALFILVYKKTLNEYILPLLFFVIGIIIYTLSSLEGFSSTCSVGQLRYIGTLGSCFAIISTFGYSKIYELIRNKYLLTIFSILSILIMFILGPFSTPFHVKHESTKISEYIKQLRDEKYPDYYILTEMEDMANVVDEHKAKGKIFKPLTKKNLNELNKYLVVWNRYYEGTPFGEYDASLPYLESMEELELIYEKDTLINHDLDFPINKYRNFLPEFLSDFIAYMMQEQNCWEDLSIKVFKKD